MSVYSTERTGLQAGADTRFKGSLNFLSLKDCWGLLGDYYNKCTKPIVEIKDNQPRKYDFVGQR